MEEKIPYEMEMHLRGLKYKVKRRGNIKQPKNLDFYGKYIGLGLLIAGVVHHTKSGYGYDVLGFYILGFFLFLSGQINTFLAKDDELTIHYTKNKWYKIKKNDLWKVVTFIILSIIIPNLGSNFNFVSLNMSLTISMILLVLILVISYKSFVFTEKVM